MYIIFGNYGDDTIALIEWARQQSLAHVTVVSIDTGWTAPSWHARVAEAEAYVLRCGFATQRLRATPDFSQLVRQRRSFPQQKFQWCAGILKGLTLLTWLDEVDPRVTATVLLGKRRAASRSDFDLAEKIEQSEHYGDRCVWHPLWMHNHAQRDVLVHDSGLALLGHRSLECDPCIHNSQADFVRTAEATVTSIAVLEKDIKQTMFAKEIETMQAESKNKTDTSIEPGEQFALSCGAPFACGL